jgi:hypothetical protein
VKRIEQLIVQGEGPMLDFKKEISFVNVAMKFQIKVDIKLVKTHMIKIVSLKNYTNMNLNVN